MYSDSLFNFYKLTEDQGLDAGAELLLNFAAQKPFYGMDCGIRGDDIWARADRYRACMDLQKKMKIRRIPFAIQFTFVLELCQIPIL